MMQLYLVVKAGVIDFPPCPQTVTVFPFQGLCPRDPALQPLQVDVFAQLQWDKLPPLAVKLAIKT